MRFQISNSREDAGIALILVILALFVLSVLAAAMVFTARSEVFSSYNYRVEAQAEYVAHAGVQKAISFLNDTSASGYAPLKPVPDPTIPYDPGSYYNLTVYANNPVSLYFSKQSPVTCQGACTGGASQVTLGSGGNVYPPASATSGTDVVTNWKNALTNQTVSDGLPSGSTGYGTFDVTATLLEYHSVNNALLGVPASGCTDPSASGGICRAAYEVWQVTSTGSWTGGVSPASGGVAIATVQIQATIAPMYVPYFGNALYGLCNVTMSGNVCTDSYNSAGGVYGGSVGSCASAGSPGGANAAATGAGIGSNGGITLNGTAYNIGGNVSFANAATNPSCNTGFQGTSSGVAGSVLPGPAVPTPPAPPMATFCQTPPSTGCYVYSPGPPITYINSLASAPFNTPSASGTLQDLIPLGGGGGVSAQVMNVYLYTSPAPVAPPGTGGCPAPGATTKGYLEQYTVSGGSPYVYGSYSCVALTSTYDGSGTSSSPFMFKAVDASGTGTPVINLIAPMNGVGSPTFVASNSLNTGTHGTINLMGQAPATPANTGVGTYNPNLPLNVNSALVLDIGTTASIGGVAQMNFNPGSPGVPSPDYLKLNIMGSASPTLNMTGQAALSAMITVPNGDVVLAGSGAGGVFFGSILASKVADKGNYAVHYDLSMKNESGLMYSPKLVTITRPMY